MSPSGAPLTRRRAWRALVGHQKKLENLHLRTLFAEDPQRGERLALEAVGLYLDYSKNLVTDETLRLLVKLAADCGPRERIDAMFRGEKINVTEDRAALHVALRAPRGASFVVDGENVGAVKQLEQEGATGCSSLDGFVDALAPPRAVWMMVPVAFVDETIASLVPLLASEDILIDGGNTRYHDDIRRARELEPAGIHYLDVGTSGGVWGLERGYCLMIGGEEGSVRQLDPIFAALAPQVDSVSRTPGREKSGGTAEHGYLHCGPHGAGHFVKMVHNGIEYRVMAAYAEGFDLLRHANVGKSERERDAETAPLEHPEHFQYDLDLRDIAELWRRGSVIGSWLLDLTAKALVGGPELSKFSGRVSDSGEGRWTVHAAVDAGVPAHVLTASLYERFSSRGEAEFANKVLSAMRHEFGGHQEKKA